MTNPPPKEPTSIVTRSLIWLPTLAVVIGGWVFRWMADDGFIYLRVVENLVNGHGMVFNLGERVEVATGPLWVALLSMFRLLVGAGHLEWIAVLAGLALTALGVTFATMAAVRATGLPRSSFGVLCFALVPFTWHFATSGLETGLGFTWIGVASLIVVKDDVWHSRRAAATAGIWIGLGPLIRPDFAVIMLILVAGLIRLRRPHTWVMVAGAIGLPGVYEIFRMVYYRALLPNTAIAKEAGAAYWAQGFNYLVDAATSPLTVLIIGAGILALRDQKHPGLRVLSIAGFTYGLAVIRGGGDFMRLRLLLPALLLLAVAAAGTRLWNLRGIPNLILAVAALGVWESLPPVGAAANPIITNERYFYPEFTGHPRPVTVDDFSNSNLARLAFEARDRAAAGDAAAFLRDDDGSVEVLDGVGPTAITVATGPIGLIGFVTGSDIYIVDRYSLADPIAARFELGTRSKPGHEKAQPRVWLDARLGGTSEEAELVRFVRTCGPLGALVEGISQPLTLDRGLENLLAAVPDTFLRVPMDPQEARSRFCDGSSPAAP